MVSCPARESITDVMIFTFGAELRPWAVGVAANCGRQKVSVAQYSLLTAAMLLLLQKPQSGYISLRRVTIQRLGQGFSWCFK